MNRNSIIVMVLALASVSTLAQNQPGATAPESVPSLLAKANAAHTAGDYAASRQALERVKQLRPYNSEYMYRLVLAYALLDDKTSAYGLMLEMQQQGLAYDFTATDETMNIRGTEVFTYVNGLMQQAAKPFGQADPVFTLPENIVAPQAIAWDGSREKFLVGTMEEGQVLAVDGNGQVEELVRADDENGMWAVIDVLVDEQRNRLWVSSASIPGFKRFSVIDKGRSALFEFDLKTLELIRRYPVPVDGRPHVLGSMVMNPGGDIFIADRVLPMVYKKPADEAKLSAIMATRNAIALRGVAMQPDGSLMYLADREMGIMVVDLRGEQAAQLKIPETLNVGGIDGLYLWKNNLVMIQNGIKPQRVMRLQLDSTGTQVTSVRPLAVAQPDFDFPSFGTVKGKDLYFFANSHWLGGDTQPKAVTVSRTALDASEDLVSPEMMLHMEQERIRGAIQQDEVDKD